MLTVGFAEEPRVKPVMVAEKSWMERRSAGFGGFAVSTTETVAVPPPQLTTQPPPGTPLQDARRSAETNRSAAAETLRIMDYPVIPKFLARRGRESAKPGDYPTTNLLRLARVQGPNASDIVQLLKGVESGSGRQRVVRGGAEAHLVAVCYLFFTGSEIPQR